MTAKDRALDPRASAAIFNRYLVNKGRVDAVGVGAGGEITSVTHPFQMEGRFDPSNSP